MRIQNVFLNKVVRLCLLFQYNNQNKKLSDYHYPGEYGYNRSPEKKTIYYEGHNNYNNDGHDNYYYNEPRSGIEDDLIFNVASWGVIGGIIGGITGMTTLKKQIKKVGKF